MVDPRAPVDPTGLTDRSKLRLPPGLMVLAVIMLPLAAALTAASIITLWGTVPCVLVGGPGCSAFDMPVLGQTGMAVVGMLGVIFFGLGFLQAAVRLSRPVGWIEITPRGLTIACYSLGPMSGLLGGYFCAGFCAWANVASAGIRRVQTWKCLGIAFSDPNTFLAGRATISDQAAIRAVAWGARLNGIVLDVVLLMPIFGQAMGLIMRLIGYSGLPKSSDEKDILEWNRNNWDYHVLIPVGLVPEGSRILDSIRRHQTTSLPLRPAPVSEALSEPRPAEARLRELKELLTKELISQEEYDRKRREIIADL